MSRLSVPLIAPRYRPDRNLFPLIEKATALVPEGRGDVLDLSGGGKGAYLACKTPLRVDSGLFDMSLHRFGEEDLSGAFLEERLRLIKKFALSERQALAILAMRLQQLTGLETKKNRGRVLRTS